MSRLKKALILLLPLLLLFSIKPAFDGEITIRLNEPDSFDFTSSNYSNLIFYSLIHENFFYLNKRGDVYSHLFSTFHYDRVQKAVKLVLKENLSFSNGDPVTANNIKISLRVFLSLNLASAKKIGNLIKDIMVSQQDVTIQLLFDNPDILRMLTTPELILRAEKDQVFSGVFIPHEWEKGRYIILKPNPFYAGGRTYLNSVKVVFYDFYYPDLFLSKPGQTIERYRTNRAGVYQNTYLCFPRGSIGQNTRIALYFLLKNFFKTQDTTDLSSFTSDEESPISINIRQFSKSKVRSILRYSKIILYVQSSLKELMKGFDDYLKQRGIHLETIFINNDQLGTYLQQETSIRFLLLEKVFNHLTPVDEKIKRIVQEMSFNRFNEKYLGLLNQLNEVKLLKNQELLMNHVSKIIETVIKEGFILPIFQKKYSLYISDKVKDIFVDYYGRPLMQEVQKVKSP